MKIIDTKIVYQFKSRLDNTWKDCTSKWDMEQYQKYLYETRVINRDFERNATIGEILGIESPSKVIFELFT